MDKIWANRLIAGTKTWKQVPDNRKDAVRAELKSRVAAGKITPEKYEAITGETYTAE